MRRLLLCLTSALLVFIHADTEGTLRHRYSFTNGDTTAVDSVGGQHGTLEGGAAVSGNAVQLDGSNGYVNLSPDLITGYTALTFEAWFTYASDSENWSRVWDFGDTNPVSGYGRDYVFFTPRSNAGTFRYAISDADPGFDHENIVETTPTPAGVPVHVAVVHNGTSVSLYVNGSPAASDTFSIPLSAVNNDFSFLGKSLYDDDPLLKGSIDEFRIYDDALDEEAIAESYAMGPDMQPPLPVDINETEDSTVVFENSLSGVVQDSYTVELEYPPTASVTVTATASEPALLRLGGNEPGVTYDVVFGTGQTGPKTVTVESVNTADAYAGPRQITISHSAASSDPNYNGGGISSVSVTYYDDDMAYVLIDMADGIEVTEMDPGEAHTYTVQLLSVPSGNVEFALQPDPCQIVVDPCVFTISPALWYEKQTINVYAVDDNILEHDPHNALMEQATTSSDSSYDGLTERIIPMISENDCGAWGYNEADLNYDCTVDFDDYAIFALYWLDMLDTETLEELAGQWLYCTIPNEPDCEKEEWVAADYSGGYLFSYFKGNGDGLHLTYSYDGFDWYELNDDQPFLTPTIGSELMRDPCIIKGPDGLFHMVWTTGWWDMGIGYASSADLINWSDQLFVPVMAEEPNAKNCWAPEVFYDKAKQRYQIFWATTIEGAFPETAGGGDNNHRIYYVTTEDFETFSSTELFFEPGFNVIDATILEDNLMFYMFVKNETLNPVEKNIRMSTGYHADGPWGQVTGSLTQSWVEGPSAIKIDDSYIVYFDKYTAGTYGAIESTDLQNWTDVSGQLNMPSGANHGTIFRASSELIDSLIAY